MKKYPLILTAVVTILSLASSQAATFVDGSSAALAAYSAKQILFGNPNPPSGLYWFDEDMGLGSPFQAWADMVTGGGGWTLGVVSMDAAPASSISISTESGVVSAPFGTSHTRDLAYLGVDQDAEFLYEVKNSTTTIFLGTYFGRFGDTTPTFSTSTDTFGLNGQLDSAFDFHRPDRNYDVSILVRESTTPAARLVPEPASILLFGICCVSFGIGFRKKFFPYSVPSIFRKN